MTTTLPGVAVAATDQENVDPSINHITNVCSTMQGVRAAYIDGSAKEKRERSRGPRISNTEKIESLLCFINGVETRSRWPTT